MSHRTMSFPQVFLVSQLNPQTYILSPRFLMNADSAPAGLPLCPPPPSPLESPEAELVTQRTNRFSKSTDIDAIADKQGM